MQIGPLNIKIPILLAPMAGVTDYPFRVLCKAQGAGVVYSEFVSAHGIIRENAKTWQMIKFTDVERPIGIQIFGDTPEVMSRAAKMVVDKFFPDILDINYGCPVPKVTKRGAGSAALKDLCLMDDITAAVVESVPEVPVTVKNTRLIAIMCDFSGGGTRIKKRKIFHTRIKTSVFGRCDSQHSIPRMLKYFFVNPG